MGHKRRPHRFADYQHVHDSNMQMLKAEGFVLDDDLRFQPFGDQLIALTGAIRCEGEIIVEVEKMLEVQSGSGHNAFVLTTQYRYHAMLPDGRNILRYENSDHHQFDHVHRYDPSAVDRKGTFQRIQARDDVPTLGDVLRELRSWYEEHADRLMA